MALNLLLPIVLTGRVIGKGGERIKAIKEESGALISIANDPLENTTERKVLLAGTVESVLKALKPIVSILADNALRLKESNMVYYTPANHSGYSHRQYNDNAPQKFPEHVTSLDATVESGNGGNFENGTQSSADSSEKILAMQITVPSSTTGFIIGYHGNTIRGIRMKSGAEIVIADSSVGDERSIVIKGTKAQNAVALNLIQSTLAHARVPSKEPESIAAEPKST